MLFVDILLLFYIKWALMSPQVESTSRVYGTLTSLHKLSSLITMVGWLREKGRGER